jgi:hypothetical protein
VLADSSLPRLKGNPQLQERINNMKHLLNGIAIAAALALAAPAWAQGGGNPMGMPGPSPGGPGLTSYSSGQTPSSSATPSRHRHARHATHATRRGPQLTGSTAGQLNQEELGRLQAGNFSNPAAPPAPGMSPPPPGPGSAAPWPGRNPPASHQMGGSMGPKASSGAHIPPGQP